MPKLKHNVPAVTNAAIKAAKSLTAWNAIEAHGQRILEATRDTKVKGEFAELHFSPAGVQGVIKAGNVVIKIEA